MMNRKPNTYEMRFKAENGGTEEKVRITCHWDPHYLNLAEEVMLACRVKLFHKHGKKRQWQPMLETLCTVHKT